MIWIIAPLLLFAAFGIYVRRKAARLRAEDGTTLVVAVKLAGDGMATRDELHLRHSIEDEIARRGIGRIADAGSGEGVMYLHVVAGEAEQAAAAIRELLEERGVVETSTVRAVTH